MNLKIECYELSLKKNLNKDDHLTLDSIELHYIESYKDSLKHLINYFSSSSELPGITKIYRQGVLIRPQFRGKRKKHEKPAIGLATSFINLDKTYGKIRCKPLNANELKKDYNLEDIYFESPIEELLRYVAWLIDLSQIYPYTIVRLFKVLYLNDQAKLKNFLKRIYSEYKEPLNETLKHLKVPNKPSITITDSNNYYIMYRCQRTFVAAILTPNELNQILNTGINKILISNTVAYLKTSIKEAAYYYLATINYLALKVKELGGKFILNQYGRPIEAIKTAQLQWRGEQWQQEISQLSIKIHEQIRPTTLRSLKLPPNLPLYEVVDKEEDINIKQVLGKKAIETLYHIKEKTQEYKQIYKTFENNIKNNNLKKAIQTVSETHKKHPKTKNNNILTYS